MVVCLLEFCLFYTQRLHLSVILVRRDCVVICGSKSLPLCLSLTRCSGNVAFLFFVCLFSFSSTSFPSNKVWSGAQVPPQPTEPQSAFWQGLCTLRLEKWELKAKDGSAHAPEAHDLCWVRVLYSYVNSTFISTVTPWIDVSLECMVLQRLHSLSFWFKAGRDRLI